MRYVVLFTNPEPDSRYTMICKGECTNRDWKFTDIPSEYPIIELDEYDALVYNLSQGMYYLEKVEE